MTLLYDMIKDLLLGYKLMPKIAIYGSALWTFIILIIFSMILFFISKIIVIRFIGKVVRRTKGMWGIVLHHHKFFHVLIHILPAVLIYGSAASAIPSSSADIEALNIDIQWFPNFVLGIGRLYILIIFISASLRFLDSALDIYETYPYAKERAIKGYVQLVKILIYCTGGIFMLAILMGQNPTSILAGLGALTAVLAFVFKDPILGFVASIQLAANKMVKQGDWITLPKYEIDGTVQDITLTTVKIQNWDKTITTIPTYSLVSEPMKNWNGMIESGGRRIQRSISIDMTSIRFCDEAFLGKLKKQDHLVELAGLAEKAKKSNHNASWGMGVTNLTVFLKYLENFINNHPGVHKEMGKMVRLLPSGESGLPVEVTFFSKEQDTDPYERLQSSIFDHILAVLPQFDLRVFQNPTGHNLQYNGNPQFVAEPVKNN
jgi:miniconductance mechanosensitive channel